MKSLIITITILILIFSCSENAIVDPGPDDMEHPTVNFKPGNIYYWHHGEIDGFVYFDWFQYESIVGDTSINNRTYYIFSNGDILRSSDNAVMRWAGQDEITWYPLKATIGDTVWVLGKKTVVMDAVADSIFNTVSDTYFFSNRTFTSDTIFDARCSTIFGLLYWRKFYQPQQETWSASLMGVKIDSIIYGDL